MTVRTVGELHIFQLTDRISEMAGADPDASVRPIAQFDLTQLQGLENPLNVDQARP